MSENNESNWLYAKYFFCSEMMSWIKCKEDSDGKTGVKSSHFWDDLWHIAQSITPSSKVLQSWECCWDNCKDYCKDQEMAGWCQVYLNKGDCRYTTLTMPSDQSQDQFWLPGEKISFVSCAPHLTQNDSVLPSKFIDKNSRYFKTTLLENIDKKQWMSCCWACPAPEKQLLLQFSVFLVACG